MNVPRIWVPDQVPVLRRAAQHLLQRGYEISDISDGADFLLLPVPVKSDVPSDIPPGIPIFGGNLSETDFPDNPVFDLLKDDAYLYQNAAITADCAIRFAGQCLPVVWAGCPVLVIGYGRIGRFLVQSLTALGADVTIALRNAETAAFLQAAGYPTVHTDVLSRDAPLCRVIFNTVPAMIFPQGTASLCPDNTVMLDLASRPGMEGPQVIPARGLPGKLAPESAGMLIADTICCYLHQKEVLLP